MQAVAVKVAAWARRDKALSPVARLTEREREILQLVAKGLMNKQIGKLLGISAEAAEKHLSEVFAELNVSSRAACSSGAAERFVWMRGAWPLLAETVPEFSSVCQQDWLT